MGRIDFTRFEAPKAPEARKRVDLSAYEKPSRKRVDFASFAPKETLDLLNKDDEWDKELKSRESRVMPTPAPVDPFSDIKEYDGLQDDVQKFYEAQDRMKKSGSGKFPTSDAIQAIGGPNATLLKQELQRRGEVPLEKEVVDKGVQAFYELQDKRKKRGIADKNYDEAIRQIGGEDYPALRQELQRRGEIPFDKVTSEVPDFYDPEGKAVPMHRRTIHEPALSDDRYKAVESDIKDYEGAFWGVKDARSVSEQRNIAKRIEATTDPAEKQRLLDLRSELKKRGTYVEEDRLETNEDPKRDKAITEAARPIVEQFKKAVKATDDSMLGVVVDDYDLTRNLDNQIAAEQDLTKKRAMLEARRQLKEAKYIDDDESSNLKATLSSLGVGSVMVAKGANELARWGMKGLYALANDTTGLPPEIRDAINLERIGRANDEESVMQALDDVSQFLSKQTANLESVREDAAPGITERRNKIMAAEGFVDAIKKSFADPMATLSIVGDSVPIMAAGAGAGRLIAGAAGATTTGGLVGSQVAGEALIAGSVNAASVREQLMQPDVQEQIKTFPEWNIALDAAGGDEAKAMRNIADMAAGTAGVSSAALTAFFGRMFSGMNAQLAGAEVRRGLLPYARTVGGETLQEMGQEGGDKFSENVGVNQAGFQRDVLEGVPAAAGMGAVMGGAMASGIGAPQLLGGTAERDAATLALEADRQRVRDNLAAFDRPRDVARAPSTGDPDLDAGNALAEDIIASVRGQETDLERQEREEIEQLRKLLPVAPITSVDERQQAAQVLDGAPQIGSLDEQAQAAAELDAISEGVPVAITPEMANELNAMGASYQQISQMTPQVAMDILRRRNSGRSAPADQGIIEPQQQETQRDNPLRDPTRGSSVAQTQPVSNQDQASGVPQQVGAAIQAREGTGTNPVPDVAGSAQAVDAGRTDGMAGAGQASDNAIPARGQETDLPIQEAVVNDLRASDDGAVEAPQTVDENLLKMAELLSQEGSTEALPPGDFSDAAAELIPSVESEIGWTERGGNLIRDPVTGAVTGRTPWVAKPSILGGLSEFWKSRPEPISEKAAARAIEKFRNGERLAPIERRFVAYAGKYAEQVLEETQAYDEANRAANREPKTFTAPDGTEIRYSKPAGRRGMQIAPGNEDLQALVDLTSDPEAFQLQGSNTKNLMDLVGEVMPKASIGGWNSVETEGGRTARELTINLPRNNAGEVKTAKIYDDGKKVWIDVSDSIGGQGGGAVYTVAAEYAKNNGRVFDQDPLGLSDDGAYRRVSQLLSQTLKQGTTANVSPGQRLTNKDRMPVRRIQWGTDDTNNLRELTEAEVQNTVMQVPEIASFTYDFDGRQFINEDTGDTVSDADFERIAEDYRASGRGPVRRKGNSDPGAAPIGRTTLKRSVLLLTLAREAGGPRWNGILDAISRQQATGLDPALRSIFYSQPAIREALEGTAPKGDARKAAEKAWGKRLIDKLVRNRILTFVSRADVRKMNEGKTDPRTIIDDRANAFVVDGRAYIINENVSDDAAPGITLHEVGVHYGLEAMVGPEVFRKILADLRSLKDTDDRVKAAYERVPDDTPKKYVDEEALGYLVEMDPKHGLIQRIVDAIVTFMKRLGFQNEGLLNESRADEIMRIVRNSLRNAGKPQKAGVVVYSDYDNAYSQPEIGDNFYSAMARSVEQAKGAPKTGSAKQWKEWLDGAQRRGEFKQSERDWIGVDAWLDGREQTTRKELADFVRANEVQVRDVVLNQDNAPDYAAVSDVFESRGYRISVFDEGSPDESVVIEDPDGMEVDESELPAELSAALRDARDTEKTQAKFGGYRTPGDSKNYRELLLTLPVRDGESRLAELEHARRNRGLSEAEWYELGALRQSSESGSLQDSVYRSSHWDQPNVLAHVRFDERTDAEGRKVLFLQELQSDFGQDMRKSKLEVVRQVKSDFDAIVSRMKAAGVLKVECD